MIFDCGRYQAKALKTTSPARASSNGIKSNAESQLNGAIRCTLRADARRGG